MMLQIEDINEAADRLTSRLLSMRDSQGYWRGCLASSALATAVSAAALTFADREKHQHVIAKALNWLKENTNADGSWGDTTDSPGNISTTTLCCSAFFAASDPDRYLQTVMRAKYWLENKIGSLEPTAIAEAINRQYGKDRTFSAPILTMTALTGMLGKPEEAWKLIKPLPFELAVFPQRTFRFLRLSVVSYALPALIAIGCVNFYFRKPTNPFVRLLRHLAVPLVFSRLQKIQPANGGFLEAVPLTAFVLLCLASTGKKQSPIARKAQIFLLNSVRPDGSWPIDTNLSTWVTNLSINALAHDKYFDTILPKQQRYPLVRWLLDQQFKKRHPYTYAQPGGWSWTDAPGRVPDADDTAGALIALKNLGIIDETITETAGSGIKWLVNLQNADGGIPTFCRGLSAMPFDKSAADLTAHMITALGVWQEFFTGSFAEKIHHAIIHAIEYLGKTQHPDGSWIPLWFGNQYTTGRLNPLYATARVVIALTSLPRSYAPLDAAMLSKAVSWLLGSQNDDYGWSGEKGAPSSIEETALAVDALASAAIYSKGPDSPAMLNLPLEKIYQALDTAANMLIQKTKDPSAISPSPIGLYFAKLWYHEKLYPIIFTTQAMLKLKRLAAA
ncbi:MAG: prenyltransferase/squalene oxidase repeat-containing protein [Planctomycetota bacterium]